MKNFVLSSGSEVGPASPERERDASVTGVTRVTFDLGSIFQNIGSWDQGKAGTSQMYADLDTMRALQLAVGFSECDVQRLENHVQFNWTLSH